jgi:hypothetical protein
VPKSKKVKVLTHRSRYIVLVVVLEFGAGCYSAAEATQTAPIAQSIEEPTVVPKAHTVEPVEDKVDKAKEPKVEEIIKMPKNSEPSDRGKTAEGAKGFCRNSQEEDGQRAGCCAGDYKGLEPCSYKENC